MAADATQNPLNKHYEKLVLAVAALVFLAAAVYFVGLHSSRKPDELRKGVARDVGTIVDTRKAPTLDKALTPEERTGLGLDKTPTTIAEYEKKLNGLPDAWEAAVDKWASPPGKTVTIIEREPVLPKPVSVADATPFRGLGTTNEAVPAAVYKFQGKTPLSDIVWAGVVGQLDLTEQANAFLEANDPWPPDGVVISKVEIQRQELKPDGTWSEWKAVPPALPAAAAAKTPKLPANPRDKAAAQAWYTACVNMQADVRRWPFYTLVAQDAASQTAQTIAGNVTGVERAPQPVRKVEEPPPAAPPAGAPAAVPATPVPAAPAEEEASPWAAAKKGPTAAPTTTTPAPTTAAAKHVMATLWAYDATVEPGKTYRYQMRASICNPVFSYSKVRDVQARWTLEITGNWSRPSKEVTVPQLVDFYFIGIMFGEKANIALHKWLLGKWQFVRSVPGNLGTPITYGARMPIVLPGSKDGTKETIPVEMSPQAFLVDVIRNFPYLPEGNARPVKVNILVYADAQGHLRHRIDWEDKKAEGTDRQAREGTGPPPPKDVTTPTPKPPPPPKPPKEPPAKKAGAKG